MNSQTSDLPQPQIPGLPMIVRDIPQPLMSSPPPVVQQSDRVSVPESGSILALVMVVFVALSISKKKILPHRL